MFRVVKTAFIIIPCLVLALFIYSQIFLLEARVDINGGSISEIVIYFNQPMVASSVEKNIEIQPFLGVKQFEWRNYNRELHIVSTNIEPNSDYKINFRKSRSLLLSRFRKEEFNIHTPLFASLYFNNFVISQRLPAAGKTQKKIEISIPEQKMYLWQDGKIISEHIVSTGKSRTPTKIGNFNILSKHETAYGCGFGQCWKMPYWLGIYKVGASENGIHELPFLRIGRQYYRENSNSLGKRVSHGCVRVSISDSKIIYDWAEIGTPVAVHN